MAAMYSIITASMNVRLTNKYTSIDVVYGTFVYIVLAPCKMNALARKLVTMRPTRAGYVVTGNQNVPHVIITRNELGT